MKVFKLILILGIIMTTTTAQAQTKPAEIVFNYSINGYSAYSVYINGFKILDESNGANGVKKLPPFIKKGVNSIYVTTKKSPDADAGRKFMLRLSSNPAAASTDINDNNGNLLDVTVDTVLKQDFTVNEDVIEPFWDAAPACTDETAAISQMVELNNAYIAQDFTALSSLLANKVKYEALKNGTTETSELNTVQQSMAFMKDDLKPLTNDNYHQHVKIEPVKENELFRVWSSFNVDGVSTGQEAYIGCTGGKTSILF